MDGSGADGRAVRTIVFLHGIGVGPECWRAQIAALPDGKVGLAPPLPGLTGTTGPFTLGGSAADLVTLLDGEGIDRAHVCGLSLGAMVATRFAIDYPERCASLVLSGGQDRPSPALMRLQNAVFGLMPERMAAPPGMTKAGMLSVLREVSRIDFRPELAVITARTLVLCGARDRANLPAARRLAAAIPDAELRIVPGAGHEANTRAPEAFNRELETFYAGI